MDELFVSDVDGFISIISLQKTGNNPKKRVAEVWISLHTKKRATPISQNLLVLQK